MCRLLNFGAIMTHMKILEGAQRLVMGDLDRRQPKRAGLSEKFVKKLREKKQSRMIDEQAREETIENLRRAVVSK